MSPEDVAARRPLKTRQRGWARSLARWLGSAGVRPNAVSAASVVFALVAGIALAKSLEPGGRSCGPLLVAAAACVQLRLLCNMLDGMLAVEGGLGSPAGDLWNDVPDRIADPLILVGAGLAVRDLRGGATFALLDGTTLGWLAALGALFTAYVRVLGGSLGVPQSFAGPMAKQHRMFAVTVGCLAAAVESALDRPPRTLYAALVVIVAGTLVTAVRRTARIARAISSR